MFIATRLLLSSPQERNAEHFALADEVRRPCAFYKHYVPTARPVPIRSRYDSFLGKAPQVTYLRGSSVNPRLLTISQLRLVSMRAARSPADSRPIEPKRRERNLHHPRCCLCRS